MLDIISEIILDKTYGEVYILVCGYYLQNNIAKTLRNNEIDDETMKSEKRETMSKGEKL